MMNKSNEDNRYYYLKHLEECGLIHDIQRNIRYELIPAQYETIKGKRVCIEKSCSYYANFQYVDDKGNTIVEDTKGMRTKDYIMKRKLMLYVHGIKIKEI